MDMTASSIASSVNEMLGQYVFEAIDMPLDTTTDQILVKLKSFIDRYTKIKDLILLVDMGSLEKYMIIYHIQPILTLLSQTMFQLNLRCSLVKA